MYIVMMQNCCKNIKLILMQNVVGDFVEKSSSFRDDVWCYGEGTFTLLREQRQDFIQE